MTAKYAFRQSLPVMAGYLVLGTGFGVLLETKGYGIWWSLAMSLFIYAGSMQYVAIDLLTGGASLLSAALMTLMVNARHLFYGVSMIEKYKNTGAYKPYLIFSLTDETYSLVCSGEVPEGVNRKKYYFLVSLMNQSYWVIGSVIGSLVGSLIAFNTAGIEFAMTALFIVVFVEQWKSTENHLSALTGVAASVVCLLIFGPANFVIPAMIAITVLLTVMRRFWKKKKKRKQVRKMSDMRGALMILVIAAVTALLRFIPFMIFSGNRKTPPYITYLSGVLPYAIMGMLVVYCLKNVSILSAPFGLPELLAGASVVGFHLWKRNTLLSISAGTVIYMILIQGVFHG